MANTVAFLASTIIGCYLNTYWSFEVNSTKPIVVRYWAVASLGGLVCSAISIICHLRGSHPWQSVFATVLIVPPLTYLLHKRYTYQKNPQKMIYDDGREKHIASPKLNFIYVAILLGIILILHGSALNGHWRWDDGTHLLRATQYSLIDLFSRQSVLRHASGNQLAPFNLAIYMVNLRSFGLSPSWFYAQHLFMLAVASIVFFSLLRLWLHPVAALGGASLMIAGLPVGQMAQQLMTGHYILGFALTCTMLIAYVKSQLTEKLYLPWCYSLIAATSYALACLCKEVYVPAIIILPFLSNFTNYSGHRIKYRFAAPSFLVAIIYAMVRWNLFNGFGGYHSDAASVNDLVALAAIPDALFGSAWPGKIAFSLFVVSILAAIGTNLRQRAPLLVSLIFSAGTPIVFLAASQPDWGQHARYLFLPWIMVSVSWAIWLSPKTNISIGNHILRAFVFIGFVSTAAPAAQARFIQDQEIHAMFDAYSRYAAESSGQQILPAYVNSPGYFTAVTSSVNAVYRKMTSGEEKIPHGLNIVYPSSAADISPTALTWNPSCRCLAPWVDLPEPLRQSQLLQLRHKLLLALPFSEPWPPLADGIDGEVDSFTKNGNEITMSGWIPTTKVGITLFLLGFTAPANGLELDVTTRKLEDSREQDFTLKFSAHDRATNQPITPCLIVQSQRTGEEFKFNLVRWKNTENRDKCYELLTPAATTLNGRY